MAEDTDEMMGLLDVLNRFLDGLARCKSLESCSSSSNPISHLQEDNMSMDDSFVFLKLRNALQEIVHDLESCKSKLSSLSSAAYTSTSKGIRVNDEEVDCSTESLSGQAGDVAIQIAHELLHFHKSASSKLTPLTHCSSPGDTITDKDNVITAWRTISEANKSLRLNYGLGRGDMQQLLSWLHGKDLSESSRKNLNTKVDTLVQEYKVRLSQVALDDIDIPAPFCEFPDGLEDVLKDCCSDIECLAAGSQETPQTRDEFESLILREIPQTKLHIAEEYFDMASPGKAFENSRLKMHAARKLSINHAKMLGIDASKEELELFSLRLLATTCISISHLACRTAVVMAYGKKNLVKVKPCPSKVDCEPAVIMEHGGILVVSVPSVWWLTEDEELLSAVRDVVSPQVPIAVVNAVYKLGFDLYASIVSKDEPLPTVHVELASNLGLDRDGQFMSTVMLSSRNLRKQFTKATSKLFNWTQSPFSSRLNSQSEKHPSSAEHNNEATTAKASATPHQHSGGSGDVFEDINSKHESTETISSSEIPEVPKRPPRPNHVAKKRLRCRSLSLGKSGDKGGSDPNTAREDSCWFKSPAAYLSRSLSSMPFAKPPAAVASFQELQEVINFLSGSSTSSICVGAEDKGNDKGVPKSGRGKSREARKRKSKHKKKSLQAAAQADKQAGEQSTSSPQGAVVADSGIGSTASVQSAGSEGTTNSGGPSDGNLADGDTASSSPTVDTETPAPGQHQVTARPIPEDAADDPTFQETKKPAMTTDVAAQGAQSSQPRLSCRQETTSPSLVPTHGHVSHPRDPGSQSQHAKEGSQESLYYSSLSLTDYQFGDGLHGHKETVQDSVLSASLNEVFSPEAEHVPPPSEPCGPRPPSKHSWPNFLNDKLASIWLDKDPVVDKHFKPDIWSSPSDVVKGRSISSGERDAAGLLLWNAETQGHTQPHPAKLLQRSNSMRQPQHSMAFNSHGLTCSHDQLQWSQEEALPSDSMGSRGCHMPTPSPLQAGGGSQGHNPWDCGHQFALNAPAWTPGQPPRCSSNDPERPPSDNTQPNREYQWHSSEQFRPVRQRSEQSIPSGWPGSRIPGAGLSLDSAYLNPNAPPFEATAPGVNIAGDYADTDTINPPFGDVRWMK